MKITYFALLFCALASFAIAQTTVPGVPDDLANKPISQWQLNAVTIYLVIQFLGRAFTALKGGGGIIGVWRGIVYGTNTPAPPPTP